MGLRLFRKPHLEHTIPLSPLLPCQQFHQTETILQEETGLCRGDFIISGNPGFHGILPPVNYKWDGIAGVGHEPGRRGVVRRTEYPVLPKLFDALANGCNDLGVKVLDGLYLVFNATGMG